jgi:mono/diheme cytochrome c family protein
MKGLFGFFTKRAETPIESRDYGKIYLILSGLLFIGTMWSVIDEISTRRPWKEYQEQYFTLSQQRWGDRLKEAEAAFDSAAYREAEKALADAEAKLASQEVLDIQKQITAVDEELVSANRTFTFAKSLGDEAYYFWKKSIHEGKEDEGYKKSLREHEADMAKANVIVESLNAKHDSLSKIINGYRLAVKESRSKLKELYAQIDVAKSKIEKAQTTSILIRQVMMNNFDRSNFGIPKARIDRCQTCHLGWKDDLMADAPQPFTKHPVPELLKIHDPEVYGCTPCHRGQGAALTAGMAHGDEDHYWEWPLLKGKEVYASCNSCHSGQMYMKYGERFNRAKQMLSESGCFGCHEIKGFLDVPKIGPEINNMAAKTKPEWLFRWVRNPKDYNPHTRMPNFRFTDDQAEAVTAYLTSIAKDASYRPSRGVSGGGNADRGKLVFESVGCKACHVAGSDTRMRDNRGFSYDIAPELTRAGSKLDPDWTYEWIKNPRQFRPTTRMPNLRLSDQEARDVVAYLMTFRDDRKFEQKTLSLDSPEMIKKGDKLIREYGCAGCHAIKGMEKEGRVSVALSNFGRKRVDELDFGDTKVPHTWDDWFFGKLKNSRQYATERIASKMPVFALADSEIVTLRTLVRGLVKENPEEPYQQKVDKRVQSTEAGRILTGYYNCIQCHQIEEIGGYVKAVLDDEAMAPPYLFPEGSKVQEPWLHGFLKAPMPIRPWLNLRMPTFQLTDAEISTVTKYFLALHGKELELRDYQLQQPDPKYVSVGKSLFTDLQCLNCHYTGKIPEGRGPGDLAPNLAMANARLKPEWISAWIGKPDSIQPGTKMPSFFPDLNDKSPYSEEFNADTREQIKAIRDYVFTIGKNK